MMRRNVALRKKWIFLMTWTSMRNMLETKKTKVKLDGTSLHLLVPSCVWRFPTELPCFVYCGKATQSRHTNHSRRSTVKRWHTNTIQQRAARICTKRSRNFWDTAGASSIELSARFLAQGNDRLDRTPASQMWGQLFTERANRPAVGSIDETVGEAMQQVAPETSYLLGVCADAFFKIQCSISLCVVE